MNIDIAIRDLRYAFRTMRRTPALTAVIVLSLAIGIGANTAMFSVAEVLFLKPLPYPHPDRLSLLFLKIPGLGIQRDWLSPGEFEDIRSQNQWFSEMSIARGDSFNVTGTDDPVRVEGLVASSGLFRILGARALLGRTLLPEDDRPGKPLVAVLTYGVWQRLYGGNPAIVGQTIIINGNPSPVVGVLDRNFVLNGDVMPMTSAINQPEMFIPLQLSPLYIGARFWESFSVIARLKPGVSLTSAQAGLDVIAARIRRQDKRDPTFSIVAVPMTEQVEGGVRGITLVLLGSVGFVLLIACSNAANLLLSRAVSRQKEAAIRVAVGSGRGRLFRQLLTESVVLSLCGGVAGMGLAWGLIALARVLQPGNIPRVGEIGLNAPVLLFTCAMSVITGVFFGVFPALRVSGTDLNAALRGSGRGLRSSVKADKLRDALVVVEIAFSLVLLIGAGLLVRSFVRLQQVAPGFSPERVVSMMVTLKGGNFDSIAKWTPFLDSMRARVGSLPGVESVGATSSLPLSGTGGWSGIEVDGFPRGPDEPEFQSDQRNATPDYFETLRIPLLAGRYFNERDTADSTKVAVVDEKMARRFWPNGTAIGKRLRLTATAYRVNPWIEIVGVVGVVKQYGLDTDTRMTVYFPEPQLPQATMYIVVRTRSDAAVEAPAIVRAIHSLDPQLPVYGIRTMEDRLARSLARQRFAMSMLGAFAGFALILAMVGIYGVVSYLVTQSTHDIGIRMALGALPRNILGLVIAHGMKLALAGLVAGLLGAFALTRLMESLLFGVHSSDALTFASVALLLGLVALVASYVPAMRAARLNPTAALRED
jgi:predicted permease